MLVSPLRELEGKVAFITGGSSGIGLGIARACYEARMNVVITYLTDANANSARQYFRESDRFHAIRADVRDRREVEAAASETVSRFGFVNLICANAGVGLTTPICKATFEDWDYVIETNIKGVANTIAVFLPMILKADNVPRHIVATASMSGMFHGGSAGLYTTTKFAVVGMMEALRGELQPKGIGVSVFCPGMVRSRIFDNARNRQYSRRRSHASPSQESVDRLMSAGMEALECGTKVLCGIRRNDMYIFTHPEYFGGLKERFDAILEALDVVKDPVPTVRSVAEARVLRHPVYTSELERLRHARRVPVSSTE